MSRDLNQELLHHIRDLTQVLRLHRAWVGGGWGAVMMLSLSLIAVLSGRCFPLWHQDVMLLALVWGIGLGIGTSVLLGYIWPCPFSQRLRLFDRRLHLAERLTTAWELAEGDITASPAFVQLQVKDTVNVLRHVDARFAFPARLPRWVIVAVAGLLLVLIPMLLLPNPQEGILSRKEAQQAALAATLEHLEAAQTTVMQSPALSAEEREAALAALEEALQTLKNHESSPEAQQAALARAEQQLETLRDPEAETRVRHLAEAAPLSDADIVQPLAAALQRGDLETAAAYLRALTDPAGEPLTAEEVLALADALTQIADQLQATDAELAAQFREVTREIYSSDVEDARAALDRAADTLSEAAQDNVANQSLAQAQAQVQQGQNQLATAQGSSPGAAQAAELGTGAPATSGTQSGNGVQANNGAGNGAGGTGHHEDAGSSVPYGADSAPRIENQGGEISIPRQEGLGSPEVTTGVSGDARIPYREVYGTYLDAAESTLSQQSYPPALRIYVQSYFSGLGE